MNLWRVCFWREINDFLQFAERILSMWYLQGTAIEMPWASTKSTLPSPSFLRQTTPICQVKRFKPQLCFKTRVLYLQFSHCNHPSYVYRSCTTSQTPSLSPTNRTNNHVMHARAIEIAWHENTPLWSVDISAANRLVTAGGDKVARVWLFNSPNTLNHQLNDSSTQNHVATKDISTIDWLCDLRAHMTTVNIARFSLSGLSIATGADQGEIVIWNFAGAGGPLTPFESAEAGAVGSLQPRERWARQATLRGHVQDVLDLCWGADGHTLVSASVDNSVMVWDVRNPSQAPVTIRAHSNFVQGVAIDPVGKIIASLGNDRTLRLFSRAGTMPWAQVAVSTAITSDSKLFVGDTKFKTFFRRLAWSPDGSVLACPSGLEFPQSKKLFAVHLFARSQWSQPAAQCGGLTQSAVAVRFSPILYALRNRDSCTGTNKMNGEAQASEAQASTAFPSFPKSEVGISDDRGSSTDSSLQLFQDFPYRMMFAVACTDSILLYDTEVLTRPFAKVEGLHCAEHTDIAWTKDGRHLIISAVDGYASIISLSEQELGERLREDQMPRWLREFSLHREQHSEARTPLHTATPGRSTATVPSKSHIDSRDPQTDLNVQKGIVNAVRVVPVKRVTPRKTQQNAEAHPQAVITNVSQRTEAHLHDTPNNGIREEFAKPIEVASKRQRKDANFATDVS